MGPARWGRPLQSGAVVWWRVSCRDVEFPGLDEIWVQVEPEEEGGAHKYAYVKSVKPDFTLALRGGSIVHIMEYKAFRLFCGLDEYGAVLRGLVQLC
jgi:hypothetical protein